ncbi:MAG: sulfatase-like hydrolase/transferase [Chloroflexota bacterium]
MKPNILLIMSDEHGPMFSSTYGHPIIRSPHMDALAAGGVVFESAYCNSPLCVPSRASFMAGKQVHRIGAWDNGAPFPSDTVTWAHLLRAAGYQVVLDGKMHLVGPDTLHGFEAQLTRDAHRGPETPTITGREWQEPHPAGGEQMRRRIEEAGPGRARHLDFDDEVEAAALDWLRQAARKEGPWCLVAGFLAPHFPLIVPDPYFSTYYPDNVDLPVLPEGHLEGQHAAHERVRRTFNLYGYSEEQVRVGRAAYYGLVTYLDDKIGRLVAALRETGQLENTVVVYTSDHGELAGDHGLWWKNSFYEQASRVPLVVSWPGQSGETGLVPAGKRFAGAVSLVDLVRTMLDLAGADDPGDLDGDTLLPVMQALGGAHPDEAMAHWRGEAICEYYGHATNRPHRMLRSGQWKYNYYHREPAELYDLADDPQEFRNLAGDPAYAAVESALRRRVLAGWDPDEMERTVRQSQRARQAIGGATGAGRRQRAEPEPQGLPG